MTSQPCTQKRRRKTPCKLGQLTCSRRQLGRSQVDQVRRFASTTHSGRRQDLSLPPAHDRHSAGQAPKRRLERVHFEPKTVVVFGVVHVRKFSWSWLVVLLLLVVVVVGVAVVAVVVVVVVVFVFVVVVVVVVVVVRTWNLTHISVDTRQ